MLSWSNQILPSTRPHFMTRLTLILIGVDFHENLFENWDGRRIFSLATVLNMRLLEITK